MVKYSHYKRIAVIVVILCFFLAGHDVYSQQETRIHVVEGLDNFYSLSLKYDVSIDDFKKANPDIIIPRPGDTLIIPSKDMQEGIEHIRESDCLKTGIKKQETYRVALMIPFSLENAADSLWKYKLDPARIGELVPFRFIQFYHGFMMAADSLKQKGLKVEITVYDIDNQVSKVYNVLNKPELKRMDIIFGPFFKNSFSVVADFAREHQIPIVNPLSSRSDILKDNPFVFKLLPSVETQTALVAELCKREFDHHNVMIYVANKYQYSDIVSKIREAIEMNDKSGTRQVSVIDYASDSIQGFYDHASKQKPNLVIIYSTNEALQAALMGKMSELKDKYLISVIGLPEWDTFSNLESAYLIALKTHIFMSSYIDYNSHDIQGFIREYRARYLDEPLTYAYTGFDAAYYFLGALMNYGSDFYDCLDYYDIPLIQGRYRFEHHYKDGYDNMNWNVLQYIGYTLIKKSL